MQRMGFLHRFSAAFIDALLVMVAMLVVIIAAKILPAIPTVPSLAVPSMALIAVAYTTLDIFQRGTLGKKVMGLEIRAASGEPGTPRQLAYRWMLKSSEMICKALSLVTGLLVFAVLGNAAAYFVVVSGFFIFRESRQTLYDQMAKTAVFSTKAPV